MLSRKFIALKGNTSHGNVPSCCSVNINERIAMFASPNSSIRKPGFLMFSVDMERNKWHEMGSWWYNKQNGRKKKYHELSRVTCVKIQSFPVGATDAILKEVETVAKCRSSCLNVYTGTNDLKKGENILTNTNK